MGGSRGAFLGLGPDLHQAMGGAWSVAAAYSSVVFSGALAVWLVNTFASILRGSGEMLVTGDRRRLCELRHVLLAPCLIFGLGPFPALGVAGAAASLVISYSVRAIALGTYPLRARSTVQLSVTRLRSRLFWAILLRGTARLDQYRAHEPECRRDHDARRSLRNGGVGRVRPWSPTGVLADPARVQVRHGAGDGGGH